MRFQIEEPRLSRLLIAILVIGSVSICLSPLLHLSFPESSYNFLGKDKRVELEPGKSVTQVFTASRDGLDRIKIMIGDLDTLGFRDSIHLTLTERDCETLIATDTITWLTPEPKIYSSFDFDRIDRSAGQSYCLKVSYTAPNRPKQRPFIAASEGSSFADTAYTDEAKGRTYEGRSLQMRPSYSHVSFRDNLRELEERLSQYKPVFMKGWIFILGLAVALMSTLFGILIIRAKDE